MYSIPHQGTNAAQAPDTYPIRHNPPGALHHRNRQDATLGQPAPTGLQRPPEEPGNTTPSSHSPAPTAGAATQNQLRQEETLPPNPVRDRSHRPREPLCGHAHLLPRLPDHLPHRENPAQPSPGRHVPTDAPGRPSLTAMGCWPTPAPVHTPKTPRRNTDAYIQKSPKQLQGQPPEEIPREGPVLGIPTYPWPRCTQSQGPDAQTITRFMGDPMPPADSKNSA